MKSCRTYAPHLILMMHRIVMSCAIVECDTTHATSQIAHLHFRNRRRVCTCTPLTSTVNVVCMVFLSFVLCPLSFCLSPFPIVLRERIYLFFRSSVPLVGLAYSEFQYVSNREKQRKAAQTRLARQQARAFMGVREPREESKVVLF